MNKWNYIKEVKIGSKDAVDLFVIEHTEVPDDIIKGKFLDWEEGKDIAKTIEIVSSSKFRKFKKIAYCENKNALEIHCTIDTSFQNSTLILEKGVNCPVRCFKVLLFEYEDGVDIKDPCEVETRTGPQPETKEGAIIVSI